MRKRDLEPGKRYAYLRYSHNFSATKHANAVEVELISLKAEAGRHFSRTMPQVWVKWVRDAQTYGHAKCVFAGDILSEWNDHLMRQQHQALAVEKSMERARALRQAIAPLRSEIGPSIIGSPLWDSEASIQLDMSEPHFMKLLQISGRLDPEMTQRVATALAHPALYLLPGCVNQVFGQRRALQISSLQRCTLQGRYKGVRLGEMETYALALDAKLIGNKTSASAADRLTQRFGKP